MTDGRWNDYYLNEDFASYWIQRARNKNAKALVIIGLGFDPRCLIALKTLAGCGFGTRLNCLALKLISRQSFGKSASLMDSLGKSNLSEFEKMGACGSENIFDVKTHDNEGHYVGGRIAVNILAKKLENLSTYTDIIVDISGMPRGIFFPLVSYLICQADRGKLTNLHVTVVEHPELDACIVGHEFGHADYLHTFRHLDDNNTIWLPLIGSNEDTRMSEIYNKLKSSCIEICPIVPFPAETLRRVDDILVKHSDLLFEGFQISPENVILCAENTPFDIYRKIIDVDEYYRDRLGGLTSIGPITTVLSPLSSKTLSLGMLLAAVERTLPVCHVEAGAIEVDVERMNDIINQSKYLPKEIWLTGEPYLA